MRPHVVMIVCACAAGMLAAASVFKPDNIILFNHSTSIPVGLYFRSYDMPEVGAIVTVRAADVASDYAAIRHFTDKNDRFIKRIAAAAGDRVCAVRDSVIVDEKTVLHRARLDASGHSLPHWNGCRNLERDEVFLIGDTGGSFDSRYFGPVERKQIEGAWRFWF